MISRPIDTREDAAMEIVSPLQGPSGARKGRKFVS